MRCSRKGSSSFRMPMMPLRADQESWAVLRIPQATVLTRLHRARKLLESKLKGWYFDEA